MGGSIAIHGSSLDGWANCARQQMASSYPHLLKQHGYTVKELRRWVTPLAGTAIHEAAHTLNVDFMKTKLVATEELILHAVNEGMSKFKSLLLKDLENGHDTKYTIKFPDMLSIRAHVEAYTRLYAIQILPQRNLEISEQHFNIPINDEFHFKSTLDSFGGGVLYDLKTGAVKTPAYHQLGIYVYLLKTLGFQVDSAQLDYIQRPKEFEPPVHRVIKYNATECEQMAKYMTIKVMKDIKEFIQSGDINVLTANPRASSCNMIMCPLFGIEGSCGGWKDK